MKKTISLCIAAALLLSMLLTAAPVKVQAAENLMSWNFESGNLAEIGTADGSDADGYHASGDVSVVSGGANGSGYALKISGANSGNGKWFWNLKSNTDYEVSFYAKIENWGGAAYPNFGVNNYDGDAYQTVTEYSGQWTKYSIAFRTGANSNGAHIYTWIFGEGAVDYYIDEVVLTEGGNTALLKNWDFEYNDLSKLGTADGSDGDGYNAAGDVSIVAGGADGSSYSLKINGANSGNGQWVYGLKTNTKYEVRFQAKIANRDSTAYPNFGINGYDGDAYQTVTSYTGDWATYTIPFTTGTTNTSAKVYTWVFGSGNVEFYLDNVTVTEVDMDPLKDWTFEHNDLSLIGTPNNSDADGYNASGNVSIAPEGANGSAYSLKISNVNSGNGQWIYGLNTNTQYELRYQAKIANRDSTAYPNLGVQYYGGDTKTIDKYTEEWATYSIIFTTDATTTQAKIYTWIFGSGNADFYIDNLTVIEIDSNPLKDWNFEHNDLSALGTTDASDADGYNAAGDVTIVSGGANGTAYALKISGVDCSGNGQWIYDLKPNTDYQISFYAKVDNKDVGAYPNFGVTEYGGATKTISRFTGEWARYTINFTTDSTTKARVYTWIFGTGYADFYIDEVELTQIDNDPLKDWDFEHNDLSQLGSAEASDADGYNAAGNVSIVPDGANGTAYSLRISGANSGNGQWIYGLDTNTEYELKFWAKIANRDSTAYPNVGVSNYGGDAESFDQFTEEWVQYTISFRTDNVTTSARIYTWIFGEGEVDFYLDELVVTAKTGTVPGSSNNDPWITNKAPIEDYAYSFAIVGDTQKVAISDVNNGTDDFANIYNYIVSGIEDKNIQTVIGLGDITDTNAAAEWAIAKEHISKLDGKVPYILNRGNHDQSGSFNDTFGGTAYESQLAGTYDGSLDNSYITFTVNEYKYLVLALDLGANDDVLAWANDVVANNPDHNVIISTHGYLNKDGSLLTADNYDAPTYYEGYNNADDMWNKLIRKHENIVLVLGGHIISDRIVCTEAVGDNGNKVMQMLINPQGVDAKLGSTGMVAMFYFSEDGKTVQVEYYSTAQEAYYLSDNQFTFELDVVETDAIENKIEQWNLSLGGDIGVNFYAAVTDPDNTQIRITVAGEINTYDAAQCVQKDGLYTVSVNVAAAQMTDVIAVELVCGEQVIWTEEYSVYQYAQYILEDSKQEFDADIKALVKEMLNYGAAAQTYFAYNPDNTIDTTWITDAGTTEIDSGSITEMMIEGSVNGIRFYGATLLFKTKIGTRFYFTADSIDGISFAVNGTAVTPKYKDGLWYVELDAINPQSLNEIVYVTVSGAENTLTVSYSPMNYIVRMSQKCGESLQALLKALYNYHLVAK